MKQSINSLNLNHLLKHNHYVASFRYVVYKVPNKDQLHCWYIFMNNVNTDFPYYRFQNLNIRKCLLAFRFELSNCINSLYFFLRLFLFLFGSNFIFFTIVFCIVVNFIFYLYRLIHLTRFLHEKYRFPLKVSEGVNKDLLWV